MKNNVQRQAGARLWLLCLKEYPDCRQDDTGVSKCSTA